jgi:hypothetical protein
VFSLVFDSSQCPSRLAAIRVLLVSTASHHDLFQGWMRFGLRDTTEILANAMASFRLAIKKAAPVSRNGPSVLPDFSS